ncbi:MAG: cytochrome B6 [Desulfuromonas sp.]|uniref:QcrA and Rieske domain-containing protein n=1 Tax=Desulfuromonas sp. TaxID=892 RepID=UPI000CBD820A|nr:ubiquinol-cytochrome c reductase iron-sulfur subunit [Desulfuromonas sp.]PLX81741.1 MAG: cytochrome B6 [Desulfuromonas sp.]
MEKTDRSRRRFLKGLAFGAACSLVLWKFLVPGPKARKKTLLQVKKAELPAEGALVYRESRVAIVHSGEEVYALSLVCTHLGCTVNVTPDRIVCPCHGSVFDRQGRVLKGPAPSPLERLEVRDEGGTLVVLT